ncbi:MAG: leucine-rich repeat domain-containing protein [Bacteroidales bacterium]|nr:leucine-rich repeat domain-containing protein [Bacteroidales bacterium]
MKRIFLLTCVALLSCAAQAQLSVGDYFERDSIFYLVLSDSTVETYAVNTKLPPPYQYNSPITIPDTFSYQGHLFSVIGIGACSFRDQPNLPSIQLPNTIRYIGKEAFLYCYGLSDFEIPSSVDSIYSEALSFGNSFTHPHSIRIPANTRYIEPPFLSYSDSLQYISVEEGNTHFCSIDGVLYTADTTRIITYPPAKEGTEYSIHDSTKVISRGAFSLSQLQKIKIPEGLKYIESHAFYECQQLSTLNLPASARISSHNPFITSYSITNLTVDTDNPYYEMRGTNLFSKTGDTLFYMVTSHDTTRIPEGTKVLAPALFANFKSWREWPITAFIVPDGVTTIMDSCFLFRMYHTKYIRLPESVTYIGDRVFTYCTALNKINIPKNTKHIGQSSFEVLLRLERGILTLPDSIEYVGPKAFQGATGTSKMQLGHKLKRVEPYAFYYIGDEVSPYDGIELLTIPASVKYISEFGFHGHHALTIKFEGDVDTIEDQAFWPQDGPNYMQKVILHNVNPPVLLGNVFRFDERTGIFVIPCGSRDNYLADPVWSQIALHFREDCNDDPEDDPNTEPGVGIETPDTPTVSIRTEGLQLVVSDIEGQDVQIFDISGRLLLHHPANSRNDLRFRLPSAGLYVVHVGEKSYKVVAR